MTPEDAKPPHDVPQRQSPPQAHPGQYQYMDGDGWVDCDCGRKHWGVNGAAGLLLTNNDGDVLLQHRAIWSHQGGTWGIPGGARQRIETAAQAALREAEEEAGIDPSRVVPVSATVLDHGSWSYTTVLAEAVGDVEARVADAESTEISWIPTKDVPGRELLVAFGEAWPLLRTMIGARVTLVVDAANVIGSRPFEYVERGWWTDRSRATQGLYDDLCALASRGLRADLIGLPGAIWWPRILMVVEGEASGFAPARPGPVVIVAAPGHGDDEIVRQVKAAVDNSVPLTSLNGREAAEHVSVSPGTVFAVTSDRELRARVAQVGGRSLGARSWR